MTVNVLDGKPYQSLDDALYLCRELMEDADFPTVKRWREAGGKVLGHFQVYFPEEIAHAAGMLPVKVRGASIEARQAEARFGSYLCSIIKTSLELSLSGRVPLDMFVSHPICDVARNLAAVWGRNFKYPCQILYLPQNANSKHAASYLRGEYDRLKRDIETSVGRKVTDDDLRSSIAVFNENRRLLRHLYALKRETPWLLSTDEAYVLMAVGGIIPREDPRKDRRVQRLHPPIHHLGALRDLGDVGHLEARLAQRLGGAAGGDELHALGGEATRKIDKPRLVADRKERAGNLLHGRMSREQS